MAITFEKTPLEWKNSGTEPSTDLKENGFSAGYRPAASTFNYQINNTSECLTELQTKLSDLDQDAIKGIKGNGTTINPSSTGIINITPNNIGAAASTHYHNASQITSGVLPIERGGTGATTLEEALEVFGGGTILFSNESGTNAETITLSDDISNYKYVEVYYQTVSRTHKSDGERPEYYEDPDYEGDGYLVRIPSEGLPEVNKFSEDIFPNCVGMAKTNVIANSSGTNILLIASFVDTQDITVETSSVLYIDLKSIIKVSEYRINANLTGNVLSYNANVINNGGFRTTWIETYYHGLSNTDVWTYCPPNDYHLVHTGVTTTIIDMSWEEKNIYPTVYAIVGYK